MQIHKKISDVLNSNSYILGNEVKKFEKNFSKYLGIKYSLGVSNGTDALILALKAIDIKWSLSKMSCGIPNWYDVGVGVLCVR